MKIMWNIFFDLAFDFFMAFGKFKRALNSFASCFLVFSYLRNTEMHAVTFDKLLRALTTYESMKILLSHIEQWLMLLKPLVAS